MLKHIHYNLLLLSLFISTVVVAGNNWPVFEAFTITPRAYADRKETPSDRDHRGRQITKAIEFASPDTNTQAALLSLANVESLFARRIQFDRCLPNECDSGLARGIWQLQKAACPAIWKMDPGPDRLKIEAICARDIYYAAIERCKKYHPDKLFLAGLAGYRGPCLNSDDRIREKAFRAYSNLLTNGIPKAPAGWSRDSKPLLQNRKHALRLIRSLKSEPGEFIQFNGVGALVEWHWHDPSSNISPKGWHIGLSLYKKDN